MLSSLPPPPPHSPTKPLMPAAANRIPPSPSNSCHFICPPPERATRGPLPLSLSGGPVGVRVRPPPRNPIYLSFVCFLPSPAGCFEIGLPAGGPHARHVRSGRWLLRRQVAASKTAFARFPSGIPEKLLRKTIRFHSDKLPLAAFYSPTFSFYRLPNSIRFWALHYLAQF